MSSQLSPSLNTISAIRASILDVLKAEHPKETLINVIGPLLSTVNLWSSQIPHVLEGAGSPNNANIIFAIRKDLFNGPFFQQTVFGVASTDLPAPFQEFLEFIQKLIVAQKPDKEAVSGKVCLVSNVSVSKVYRYFA
jgi:hypothetical protein